MTPTALLRDVGSLFFQRYRPDGRRPMPDEDRVALGTYVNGNAANLTHVDRRRHVYVIGKTGTGKSTLLKTMMLADLRLAPERGFALLDPHGDLAREVADSVTRRQRNHVIYWDPSDAEHVFGFNPLQNVPEAKRATVAANIVETFAHIWGTSLETAPRMTYILTNALRLLLDSPGTTLLGLPRLLRDEPYRDALLKCCGDPVVRYFWVHEFAAYDDKFLTNAISPIQNKIGQLLSPPLIRNILGQPRSTIDLRQVMDEGKVLIVNLAKGALGAEPAHLLGALLASGFAQAAESRANIREHERRDFTLYADEFQHFASDSFATILSEARKWRLSCVLSHQFMAQLDAHSSLLRKSVIGNTGSMICFRVGAEDAMLLADELSIDTTALTDATNFTARVKLMQDGVPTEARLIEISPPVAPATGQLDRVRNRSRAKHTRPRDHIDRRIAVMFQNQTGAR